MPTEKTVTYTLYKFDELDEKAKDKARDWFRMASASDEWWDCTYEDAKTIGLELTGFDIDRGSYCKGELIDGAFNCANAIIKEHGETCETYKTAKAFLDAWEKLPDVGSDDLRADDADAIEGDFLQSLLEDYSIMLQKECEYLQSAEHISEMIDGNDYTFDVNGNRKD